jgi:putative ABC transport system permease protein
MLDSWQEMFALLWRNRLRTLLTGLSVAWGIFMLVILMAAGTGLQNGVLYDFRDDATNSVWFLPGETSLAHQGTRVGRTVKLRNADVDAVAREIAGIEHITGRFYLRGDAIVRYRDKTASFDMRGCHPDHLYLERTIMLEGRFINPRDIDERRKVAVIGPEVKRALFGDAMSNAEVIGKMIEVNGINYRVVGLYRDEGRSVELRKIYIPISTAQLVYHGADRVHHLMYTVGDAGLEDTQRMAEQTQALLADRLGFSVQDRRALSVTNNLIQFQKVTEIFSWIRVFVWVVSLGTLLAGIVGVSNIMLIGVKERTVEFGIRKAIGAPPASIVRMVLMEALFVTSMAGYAGLVGGALLVETVKQYVPENDYVRNPDVDFGVGIAATLILITAGALAGLFPAMKAAAVKPVVAMRET